ncbi:hypothetical protein M8J77_016533 [Diaphorina citri]|nr:hypothetical protein M8J77_016533 [Diaphorina citri]
MIPVEIPLEISLLRKYLLNVLLHNKCVVFGEESNAFSGGLVNAQSTDNKDESRVEIIGDCKQCIFYHICTWDIDHSEKSTKETVDRTDLDTDKTFKMNEQYDDEENNMMMKNHQMMRLIMI